MDYSKAALSFTRRFTRLFASLFSSFFAPLFATLFTALSAAMVPGCVAIAHAADRLLIENITPIDPVQGALPVQDIMIEGDRILAMGDLPAPGAGVQLMDGRDRFLIPGLWDMHVHLTYEPRLSNSMGDLFLDYGITSIRDTGGMLATLAPVVDAMRNRGAGAPRVFYSGPLLDGRPTVYDGGAAKEIGVGSTSEAEARARVAALNAAGVDFIKIYEMVTPQVFNALVAAARERELPIAAHVPLSMLAREAGPQVQSLEHLRNLELDCARDADALLARRRDALAAPAGQSGMALRSSLHRAQRDPAIEMEDASRCADVIEALRNTIQVPTLRLNAMTQHPPFEAADWNTALKNLPEAIANEWQTAPDVMDRDTYRRSGQWSMSMVRRLAKAGVPIGAGTDTPIGWAVPGYSLHRELELLVEAGLTPLQALHAATVVPARFFGLEETMGRLAPGHRADLLVLTDNPLLDIRSTRRIEAVINGGRRVR